MTYPPFAPGHRPLRLINSLLHISEFSVSLFSRLKYPSARVKPPPATGGLPMNTNDNNADTSRGLFNVRSDITTEKALVHASEFL